jgi:uncharacterized lipoprotein YddW (UPF0748 family)
MTDPGCRGTGVLLLWTLVLLSGCRDGGLAGPAEGPPVLEGISPPAADPTRSPLTLTLSGEALGGAILEGPPWLFLETLDRSATAIRARVGFKGGPPGPTWIRVENGAGRDSLAFTVEPLSYGDSLTETRALWVSRFEYATPEDLARIMERASGAGFNLVYLQVRGRADAFYRSSYEPWAENLTGVLGQDPGWDPLEAALLEAEPRGLEVHAWINAFTGWAGGTPPPPSEPPHAFLQHSDWVMVAEDGAGMPYSSGTRWMTPGHPGVRSRLAAVAADIARRYRVGGVHLDYIRYPGPEYSYDHASLLAFDSVSALEPGLGFDEMRRRFVTWSVAETRDSLKEVGRALDLSAAVWGIYQNKLGWSGVTTGYESVFQDARAWGRLGIVDALVPMVYWPLADAYGDRLDFAYLADEHVLSVDGPVFVGIYVPGLDGRGLAQQVERARMAGAEGVSIFSYSSLEDESLWGPLETWAFHWPARRAGKGAEAPTR